MPKENEIQAIPVQFITEDFTKDLRELLNKHSIDTMTGTPDFILEEFISRMLINYTDAIRKSVGWRGEVTYERFFNA